MAAAPRLRPSPAAIPRTVLIVGNPNVGKSVLFKNLTRRYVTVSNFPGTTVEIVSARAKFAKSDVGVVDTPGLNDLDAPSEDARVTQRILETSEHAVLVQVADAKNLRRALLLTLQLAALGRPLVLVLNMHDELERIGGRIDVARLAALLGVPVVPTVAIRDEGTQDVIDALEKAAVPHPRVRDGRESAYERNRARLALVSQLLARTYSLAAPAHPSLSVRLGFWAMDPVRGLAILAVVLLAVFWFVGLFGAGTLADLLEEGAFRQHVTPAAIHALDAALPFPHEHAKEVATHAVEIPIPFAGAWTAGELSREVVLPAYTLGAELSGAERVSRLAHDFLVGQFGVVTMASSYALAIVLPIVTTFFMVFGVLEDSGYFSRMAILVNRVFRTMGLNGKAVLPMILGLGCDTMATMTTRILDTRRERLITTMLLALAVPCSAQLGVLLALTTKISAAATAAWVVVVVGVMLVVGRLSAIVFPGETSDFILEIPPLRRPLLANVARKTLARLTWYLKEVIPLFVFATAVLFVLDELDLLGRIARLGEPLVTGWLGLPAELANAFLVGFLRRDFGAVYILAAASGDGPGLTAEQIFVAMITITLFVPCIANLLVIAKEHGARTAVAMAAFIFPFAFLVGGLAHQVGRWLGA